MPQVQHICATKVPQRPAPLDRPLTPGRGAEVSPTGGRGGKGGGSNFAQRLWDTPHPRLLLQVPWEIPVGGGQRLEGGGSKTQEGAAEVGTSNKGVGERGGGCPDFGNVIRGSCEGSLIVWVRDLDDATTDSTTGWPAD